MTNDFITNANLFRPQVEFLVTEPGVAFTLEELESAMKKYRPDVVFVVHAESSTGLKQPLEGLAQIVHKFVTKFHDSCYYF